MPHLAHRLSEIAQRQCRSLLRIRLQVRILLSELMIQYNVILKPREVALSGELRPEFSSDIDYSREVVLFPRWSELNNCYYLIARQAYHRDEVATRMPPWWEFVGTQKVLQEVLGIHDAVAESG